MKFSVFADIHHHPGVFDGGTDERMNGTCAGGTGAFIDQMATLLNLTVEEMDERRIVKIKVIVHNSSLEKGSNA